ncbi:MAG: DUF503 domain-containing protein [Thermaerobacterales bacterium]
MIVGVCTVRLALPGTNSLKAKRSVIKGLMHRARRQFEVAAAEVDEQDQHRRAILAFVCVANEGRHAEAVLQKLVNWLDAQLPGHLEDFQIERR